jgi:hypothetical protein
MQRLAQSLRLLADPPVLLVIQHLDQGPIYALNDCFFAQHAEAELGPCTTVAPTTPNVIVFVSDIDRSVRWYRDNIGLAESSESDIAERNDGQVTAMARNQVGVTLVSSGRTSRSSRDIQMACFVLEGPPAPLPDSPSCFLTDPDGTAIELSAIFGSGTAVNIRRGILRRKIRRFVQS